MILSKKIFIFKAVIFCSFISLNTWSQSRFEIDVSLGYSRPLLEAYGTKLELSSAKNVISIDGKRLLVSDNLGTKHGYSVQFYLKYNIVKNGHLKGIFNVGYNALYSVHDGPGDSYGIRIQSFSFGPGVEINPLGKQRFYPSVFGVLRMNLVGGETFFLSGLDVFEVTTRFGYMAGLNLNYKVKKRLGLSFGVSYSYDNAWNKKTNETVTGDPHTIVFRDKANSTNGLTGDRRIAYLSISLGLKFYLP